MGTYATLEDVELRWNQAAPEASLDHIEVLIDDAELLVLAFVPDLEDRIDEGRLNHGLVRYVVTSMVLRVLFNPKSFSSESTGDYSYQRNDTSGDRRMFITVEEKRLLLGGRGRACTVTIGDGALEFVNRPPCSEWSELTGSVLPTP